MAVYYWRYRQGVGIITRPRSLTFAMTIKSIIALFLGLIIQFSQAQSGLAIESVKPCGGKAHSMSCCDGLKSCPCAKESEPVQKPGPLIPAGADLKLLVSKISEPSGLEVLPFPPTEELIAPVRSQTDVRCAFAGVPLSVAFCRFVI